MPHTLLSIAQDVAQASDLTATFTTFQSGSDEEQIVFFINQANRDLRTFLFSENVPFRKEATFNTVQGQRLYTLATDATINNLYSDLMFNETTEVFLRMRTLHSVERNDFDYKTEQDEPNDVYFDGPVNQIGLYKVPDAIYTIRYKYKALAPLLVDPSDTFLVPDDHMDYIRYRATFFYMRLKGHSNAQDNFLLANEVLTHIKIAAAANNPISMIPVSHFGVLR